MTPFTCTDAVDSLLEFLEGALSAEARHGFEGHLRACPFCGAFVESYRKTTVLCGQALRREAPKGATERLFQNLREKTSQVKSK